MRRWSAFGAATLALGVGVAWAQQSVIGGSSSRPTFQRIIARGAPPGDTLGQVQVRDSSNSGAAAIAYLAFVDAAGTRLGYVGDGSGGSGQITIQNDTPGAAIHLGTTGGGAVQVNGVAIPKFAYATFTGGCLTGTGGIDATIQNRGVASCVNTGAGLVTITLNAGFASTPTCMGTGFSVVSDNTVSLVPTSATNVNGRVHTNGSASNAIFGILCIGV
jgi:hypothetical protein